MADRTQPLGSDAAENRERVLAAAVTAVLREGDQVPLSTIASDAGVPVGTLSRRYPDRAALFLDLELRAYGLVIATLDEVLATDEPGLTLVRRFLERTIAHRSQLVLPLHGAPWSVDPRSDAARAEIAQRMSSILERGRSDGSIRDEVSAGHVILFGAMLVQPIANIGDWDAVARQQVDVFLSGVARPGSEAAGSLAWTLPPNPAHPAM